MAARTSDTESDEQLSPLKSHPLIMLVDEVARLQGRVKSLFAEVHTETGLKPMEDLVLNSIVEADAAPTVPQIGRSLGHPRQVIQRAVNDLEEVGYIEKLANPDHKRAPLLAITARGLKLKERSNARALAIADAFLDGFSGDRCERLAGELKAVRQAIELLSREKN